MNQQKTISRHIGVFILLMIGAVGTSLQGASAPVDPIVGSWMWHHDATVTFQANGTAHHSLGFDGTWEYLHNPEVQRHYRIIWEHGKNIDEVTCSENGLSAHVGNPIAKLQFDVRRAMPDKPAASAPPATSTTDPARIVPERTMAVVGSTMNTVDPIVGEWQWVHGGKVTFMADGTMTSVGGKKGVWIFLRNPDASRKYVLAWDYGDFVDHLSFDPSTGAGHIVNQRSEGFDVSKGPAASRGTTPDRPGSYFGSRGGG